ncbi:MAG TPA: hypothetical protein VH912_19745 [Streptosporangiaceae bacterium]|jgi:hypothetical protein
MATSVLFALVALLAIGEFLLFGALAEAYRDIRQIRRHFGMVDQPTPVDLGPLRDAAPSDLGLHPDLDAAVREVVIYVESRCGTCRRIVNSLDGGIPGGMWLVVIAESPAEAFDWLGQSGITPDSPAARRVMVAPADEVERRLGMLVTPLAIEIEHGRLVRAKSLPSVQQFYSLVPTTMTLDPEQKGAPA